MVGTKQGVALSGGGLQEKWSDAQDLAKTNHKAGIKKKQPFIDGLRVQRSRSSPFQNTIHGNENVRYILMNFEGSHVTTDLIIH